MTEEALKQVSEHPQLATGSTLSYWSRWSSINMARCQIYLDAHQPPGARSAALSLKQITQMSEDLGEITELFRSGSAHLTIEQVAKSTCKIPHSLQVMNTRMLNLFDSVTVSHGLPHWERDLKKLFADADEISRRLDCPARQQLFNSLSGCLLKISELRTEDFFRILSLVGGVLDCVGLAAFAPDPAHSSRDAFVQTQKVIGYAAKPGSNQAKNALAVPLALETATIPLDLGSTRCSFKGKIANGRHFIVIKHRELPCRELPVKKDFFDEVCNLLTPPHQGPIPDQLIRQWINSWRFNELSESYNRTPTASSEFTTLSVHLRGQPCRLDIQRVPATVDFRFPLFSPEAYRLTNRQPLLDLTEFLVRDDQRVGWAMVTQSLAEGPLSRGDLIDFRLFRPHKPVVNEHGCSISSLAWPDATLLLTREGLQFCYPGKKGTLSTLSSFRPLQIEHIQQALGLYAEFRPTSPMSFVSTATPVQDTRCKNIAPDGFADRTTEALFFGEDGPHTRRIPEYLRHHIRKMLLDLNNASSPEEAVRQLSRVNGNRLHEVHGRKSISVHMGGRGTRILFNANGQKLTQVEVVRHDRAYGVR